MLENLLRQAALDREHKLATESNREAERAEIVAGINDALRPDLERLLALQLINTEAGKKLTVGDANKNNSPLVDARYGLNVRLGYYQPVLKIAVSKATDSKPAEAMVYIDHGHTSGGTKTLLVQQAPNIKPAEIVLALFKAMLPYVAVLDAYGTKAETK